MAAALVAMVARLTVGRKAYAAVEAQAREILAEAEELRGELRRLVDEDAAAYEGVSRAYKIPKDTAGRARAMQLTWETATSRGYRRCCTAGSDRC